MRPSSLTALRAYLACPRRYALAYIDRLPMDNPETCRRFARTSLVKEALTEYHARNGRTWEQLDVILAERWNQALFRNSQESAAEYHRTRCLLWEAYGRITQGNPLRFGYDIDLDFGGGRFRGRLDRVDKGETGIILVKYHFGPHQEGEESWPLQIHAALASRALRQPVTHIRILCLGAPEDSWLEPEDPARVEADVSRLRRSMEADTVCAPRPGSHCRTCPFAGLCADADPVVRRQGRQPQAEMFRLLNAVEALVATDESYSAFRETVALAGRSLDPAARLVWTDEAQLTDEVAAVIAAQTEVEGELALENGSLRLVAGSSLIIPVAAWCLLVVPESVSRTAAEILGRSLRLAQARTRNHIRAVTDGLTGLRRRELFDEDLRDGDAVAVIVCDIDHFKAINDTHGHACGDAALRHFAAILGSRPGGVAYRIGGEEFALLVPSSDASFPPALAESLRRALAATPFVHDGLSVPVTASFGVAVPRAGERGEEMLRRADAALYRAKNQGRNRVEIAS